MEHCSRCKQDLPLDAFNLKGDVRQPFCKTCQSEYHKNWYKANKQKRIAQITERKVLLTQENKERIRVLKDVPCKDCGGWFNYWQMDFDHLHDKDFDVSTAAGTGYSWETIEKEIAKCEVVCSNCHRTRTHNRRENNHG